MGYSAIMKKKQSLKPESRDIVVVQWEDAMANSSEQHDSTESAKRAFEPCFRKSVGYYVGYATKLGRKALLLATDDDRDPKLAPQAIGGIFQIPAALIVSIEVVRKAK